LLLLSSLQLSCFDNSSDSDWYYDVPVYPDRLPLDQGVEAPPPAKLKIASYNVQRLYDLEDDWYDEGELTPEIGAWDQRRYNLRMQQLGQVIADLDADIIAIVEIEKESLLFDLAEAVQLRGGPRYDYLAAVEGSDGGGGLDLGVMSRYPILHDYKRPISNTIRCEGADGWIELDGSRPEARPILQAEIDLSFNGEADLILFVNHWKSKLTGRSCFDSEVRRVRAAEALASAFESLIQEAPSRPIIALGDFNAWEFEDPLRESLNARLDLSAIERPEQIFNAWGLREELQEWGSDNSNNSRENSSYRYRGEWSRLDHLLLSGNLRPGGEARWRPSVMSSHHPDHLLRDGAPYAWSLRRSEGYSDHLPIYLILEEDLE